MDERENAGEIRCEYAAREDIDADYAAGRLEAAEAEAFEAHYFACDACWSRVQRAVELRSALAQAEASPHRDAGTQGSRKRATTWWALAAAASVAAIALGLYALRPPEPVFRGIEQPAGFAVQVEADGRVRRVRWAPVPGAVSYELRALAQDGRVLQRLELAEPGAILDAGSDGAAVSLEIVALDELGQELSRSQRVALRE